MSCRFAAMVIAIVAACAIPLAHADPQPTSDQLDAAKRAFEEADALYKAGKLRESIVKLEESYRLSRNVFLLFNIGHAYDQSGDRPKAMAMYVKFVELAPANAPKRDEATKRLEELTQARIQPEVAATQGLLDEPVEIKPVSKYLADFRHSPADTIAPGKPIDISADAPRDANWVVTLYFRATTDEAYTGQPMTWRDASTNVLVGQIPAAKTATGTAIYYYLEVKDTDGSVVTRSGRRTSPHLVKIEGRTVVTGELTDDPLRRKYTPPAPERKLINPVSVSTTVAVVLVGATVTTFLIAKQKGDDLRFDSTGCGAPPCQVFDEFDAPLEKSGRKYNRIYQITLGASVAAIGIAGYFWVRRSKKPSADKVTIAAAVGDGFVGAFAARPW